MQGDTGGYGGASSEPTYLREEVQRVLEYASNRFSDGDHLAETVWEKVSQGADPIALRNYFARNESFLMAYFADCIWRMQEDRRSDW